MSSLNKDKLQSLLADRQPLCLSLYQATHRHHPDNQQDPIRFRNLVKRLEESLAQSSHRGEADALLRPYRTLADDASFWQKTQEGLAVFSSASGSEVLVLPRPVPNLAVVANSFHAKPLVRILQSSDRYQILGITLKEDRLYEGNRDALDVVELGAGVPSTITEALGEELTEPHLTVASYGTGVGGPSMHHGQGGRKSEVDIDAERFFRAVDRGILEHHSRPSGLPLVLAALAEHHDLFHKVSHNPFLLPEGIRIDPIAVSADRLRAEAWALIEPYYRERLAKLIDQFGEARAKNHGDADLALIARAAVAGRVSTLLVEADRHDPGHIDPTTGAIEVGNLEHPELDDLLDDLAELVMRMGGEVVVVPAVDMPVKTGAAAIYRY